MMIGQQLIFNTHMIGYDKPFRSWGRSLFDKNSSPPLQSIQQEQFINLRRAITSVPLMVKCTWFYDKEDKALKYNLIKTKKWKWMR
jgi:hypothetical protein